MTTYADDIEYSEADRPRTFELIPKGETRAVCVDVIDLGLVENPFKKNEDGTPEKVRKVKIVWETARKKKNGQPFTVSRQFKLSLYDGSGGGKSAALYDLLSAWLGASWNGKFSSKALVGTPAVLYVKHEPSKTDKTKVFPKVADVSPDESDNPYEASGTYKRFVKEDSGSTVQKYEDTFNRADYDDAPI